MSISETLPAKTPAIVAGAAARVDSPASRWAVFALVCAVALLFALLTRHVWEDFYITYRASKNLATGHGLTFTVGERVHSFTSPLGTLLPALASLLTGNSSDAAALWIFRLMSIAALGGAAVMLWQLALRLSPRRYPAVLLVALLATDAKTVDFTVNGMETPYLLLFMSWNLYALFFDPPRRAFHLGLAWAGLMWSRPDSFVYIGALAMGTWLFSGARPFWPSRRKLLQDFLLAGAVAAALYLPWLLWAWWYYGSPIPHTVIAKGLGLPLPTPQNLAFWLRDFPGRLATDRASLALTFLPPYGLNSGWPQWLARIASYLSLGTVLIWLVPWVRWEARVASFTITVGYFYLNYLANFPAPWYIPTLTLLASVALTGVVAQLIEWCRRGGAKGDEPSEAGAGVRLVRAVSALLPLGAGLLLIATGIQMGYAQRINETGNRRVMAEWLKAHAATPRDTVFIECLGYVGYFSNLKIYDWPGLCSPEVVAARRRSTTRGDYTHYFPEIISALQPDWVVLRSSEVEQVRLVDRDLLTRYYSLVKVFDSRARIDAVRFLPGRYYLEFDSHFEVYHRNDIAAGEIGLADHVPIRTVRIGVRSLISKQTWAGPAYDSNGYIAAHTPSWLTVRVPEGATTIAGELGFFPGAYEQPPNRTAGAIFTVNVLTAAGERTTVHRVVLDPSERLQDRGGQGFAAAIPVAGAAVAEFVIEPPPGKSNAFGWTYWTNLRFEVPRQPGVVLY